MLWTILLESLSSLKNISDIDAVDAVYKTFFTSYVPARTTVAGGSFTMDAFGTVEAVVAHGDGTTATTP